MITYTKQEEKALAAIEEKYRPELEAAMAEMNKYDISKQPDEYLAAANRFHEINEKIQAEREVYFKRAELRSFNSFNGDVARVVEAVKSQVQTFIYVSKALAGDEPTAKERAKQQKRIEKSRKELKEGIEHNEKLLEQFPDDQELRKNTDELKELDPERVHEFYYDTIYSEQALHERIKESFAMYFEFLSNASPEAYKELQVFIEESIKNRDQLILDRLNQLDERESKGVEVEESILSPKKQAEREGAITELGFYSATITDKYYRYALTPLENNAAYIQQLDEDFIQQLEFNPENGVMSFKSKRHEPIKIRNAVTNRSIKNLDLQLLRSLYTIIYNNATNISTDTVTVYLPTLTEHLGIRINNSKPNDLFKKIRAFENTVGVFSGGAIYKLLDFLKYEPEGNLITFASPYMNMILRQLEKRNTKTAKKGGDRYINPHHSFLVHSNIANERNKPAVEVVQIIVTLLQQRGEIKNNITTASIKFSTIIDQIPELREKLIGDTTTGNKNNYLRRTFKKAYELLRSKTDLYQYYNNLSIPEIIPSTTTIDQVITISHNGKNQNYKQP